MLLLSQCSLQVKDVRRRGKKRKDEVHVMDENLPPLKKPNMVHSSGTPAYRAKTRKQEQVKCSDETSHDLTIDRDDADSTSYGFENVTDIGYVKLSQADLDRLQQKRSWLNDSLINAGQVLLKKQYPDAVGLQDVDLSRTLCFVQGEPAFIQILNTNDSHWICVTSIGCKPNVVKVYDSMRTGNVCTSTKECIATLLNCQSKFVFILFPEVQQQTDAASCGLFALAYAWSLCEGLDPSQLVYEASTLRQHFRRCIQKKEMTRFDVRAALYKPEKPLSTKFRVYCFCRLPNSGDKMVCCNLCSEWFHFTCVGLAPDSLLGATWHCPNCAS